MRIPFDPAKNERNLAERGLSFDLVADLEWDTALAEERYEAGVRRTTPSRTRPSRRPPACGGHPYSDEAVHVISFRKANDREV